MDAVSCGTFAANAGRLQLHALAYNLGNFAYAGDAGADQGMVADEPEGEADQDRCEGGEPPPLLTFQMAEVVIPRDLFADILRLIAELRPPDPAPA